MTREWRGFTELPESAAELYEAAPEGYVYTNPEGFITHFNRSLIRWTGYAPIAIQGRMRFSDLLPIGAKIFYETHMLPLLQMHGVVNEIALDLACRDGSLVPVLVTGIQKRDAAGAPLFNRFTLFNASDRRRYERELLLARTQAEDARAQLAALNNVLELRVEERTQALLDAERRLEQARKLEAIGRLAGGVAHDFNNIVAGIAGISQELRDASDPTSALYADLNAIIKASEKAFTLTRQLLAVGQKQTARPKDIDPNEVIRGGVPLLTRMLGDAIALCVTAQPCGLIHMDPVQLEQILMNLVLNARDAMPNGGRITIETSPATSDPPLFKLVVTDTGHGMSPDVMAHIFEPFFTTKEKHKGTGLGLATVYGIVNQNNGTIDVTSTPREGARFTVCFPRLPSA